MRIEKLQKEFSIITVTYNCEKTLEKTMQSVFEQCYDNYEYWIVDGESTDGTTDIIRKYENRLSGWISEKDSGIYEAMNKGIRMATGKWILFLNSGDFFASANVLQLIADLNKKEVDILYGDIFVERENQLVIRHAVAPCNKQRMFFCHQSAFVRTEIMKQHPFDVRFKLSADFYFFKQCYYRGVHFRYIRQPLVVYDRNGISNTQRVRGLLENVQVVKELDKGPIKYLFLLRLYVVIIRIRAQTFFQKRLR